MSFQHLTRIGNEELARLLIGAAKTIFAASIIALFFPTAGTERSWIWFLAGVLLAAVLGGIGIVVLEKTARDQGGDGRKTRRLK